MPVKDYYTILGLPPVATQAEIRRAWRALAMKYHPDVNPGNAEALAIFTEIKEAYEVLTDPEKKQHYLEERWLAGYHARGFDQWGPPTPETVLKQVLAYEKYIFSQDVFRMNMLAAAAGAEALLDNDRANMLVEQASPEIQAQVVYALLRIAGRLPARMCSGLFTRISDIAAGQPGLLQQVQQVQRRRLKAQAWQQYYWVLALAVALGLTFLLWLLARQA